MNNWVSDLIMKEVFQVDFFPRYRYILLIHLNVTKKRVRYPKSVNKDEESGKEYCEHLRCKTLLIIYIHKEIAKWEKKFGTYLKYQEYFGINYV